MNNSPYLDRPLVPLAVALRSTLAEIETKIATAAPAEKAALQRGAARMAYAEFNSASRPSRVWGRTGGPSPALRCSLKASSARFGGVGGPAATRFQQTEPARAPGAIPPA